MATAEQPKPKSYYRTMLELQIASTDVKSTVKYLRCLYVILIIWTIGMNSLPVITADHTYWTAGSLASTGFLIVAMAILSVSFIINHFDARLSKLEAALLDRATSDGSDGGAAESAARQV